ncbi:MAG: hypothetical protein GX308_04135 [Epulopiscium sp.]|nr:hypothetical protein [Candidatus Epulonipiscium sp.]
MDLEIVDKEIVNTFSTYETSMENRIRYISGMHHFAEYLDNHDIELEEVEETVIEKYVNELRASGYPDIFINANIEAVKKIFFLPKKEGLY